MNKLKHAAAIVIALFRFAYTMLRLVVELVCYPFAALYRFFDKRLKFSLTFKITGLYALVTAAILTVIWTSVAAFIASSGLLDEYSGQFQVFEVFIIVLLIGVIAALLISIVVGTISTRKILRPMENMIASVQSISAGALHTRLDVGNSYDELKKLAETFNAMLDRIHATYEQQNRFISDASHELRTPISVIQGYAALLQRWGKDDKAVLEEAIQAIKNEADHMNQLAEKLLFLARAEQSTQFIEKAPYSLDGLVDEVVNETRLIDSNHKIGGGRNDSVTVCGDRGLIKQALRIFVDNSIKFTPEDGEIRVQCHSSGKWVVIMVEDTGIGIPEEELPYIFNRFYKCDKARTRNSSGTGLGLYIAKRIIESHGGWVRVESTVNKGTRMMVGLRIE